MSELTLTSGFLTGAKIDIASIKSSFEVLKLKFPEVFNTIQAIENFTAVNESEGLSDYQTCLYKFAAILNIFAIHNDDHAIKETLELIKAEIPPLYKLLSCIELEYDCYKKRPLINIEKLAKIKKNEPDNETASKAIEHEDTHHQNSLIRSQNETRILILLRMISIEHLIEKLIKPHVANECFF